MAWPGLGARWIGYLAEQIHYRGFEVLFSMERPEKAAALFGQQMLDGVVLGGGAEERERLNILRWREGTHLPLVTAGFKLDESIPSVDADRPAAIALAVSHLAEHGRRAVALITNQAEKIHGYQQGILACGLPYRPEYLVEASYDYASVEKAIGRLLRFPAPPEAVVVGNAQGASHAVHALRVRGLGVPEGMAVIGYDEVPGCADQEVPLTTVGPSAQEMAEAVADVLLAAMEEREADPVHLRIPPRLVVRRSCGASAETP